MPKLISASSPHNALPSAYIPVLTQKERVACLSRLSRTSLIALWLSWPKKRVTWPHKISLESLATRQSEPEPFDQKAWCEQSINDAQNAKMNPKSITKQQVVDAIVAQYWSRGLNLLQLSQVDCQVLLDRPGSFLWKSSSIKDSYNQQVPLVVEPKPFLRRLTADLSLLYLSYIYIFRHPRLPMMIVRIQVFDLQPIRPALATKRPHVSSRRPFYVAFPMNSPHVIHSCGDDMVLRIILQAVELSLPHSRHGIPRIVSDSSQKPVKSLETMQTLKGISRFAHSMGAWSAYADGSIDLLPLSNKRPAASMSDAQTQSMSELERVANLRFKGSADGVIISNETYEVNRPEKSTTSVRHKIKETRDRFASIAPIQSVEFVLRDPIKGRRKPLSVLLRLVGSDVFGGLHELSSLTEDLDLMVLDPRSAAPFLTGEEGASGGTVFRGVVSK